jgi:hypothetical protein
MAEDPKLALLGKKATKAEKRQSREPKNIETKNRNRQAEKQRSKEAERQTKNVEAKKIKAKIQRSKKAKKLKSKKADSEKQKNRKAEKQKSKEAKNNKEEERGIQKEIPKLKNNALNKWPSSKKMQPGRSSAFNGPDAGVSVFWSRDFRLEFK